MNNKTPFFWQSPIGWIALVGGPAGLRETILHPDSFLPGLTDLQSSGEHLALLREGQRQLQEYFAGARTKFELPIDLGGLSPFAARILSDLQNVPYGSTITYGDLAALAGHPGAARAVGRVMARNPLPIVIPCHRVLGSGGQLTGYSGGEGLTCKKWLLDFERSKR
ncbi:MAG: methylated-DNA--[protein]-cysteine S-methyltransferase [Desulfuromonadales bacterium]